MPRRKKLPAIPDYMGLGDDPDKLIVQKSNPLISLSETDLTLEEFLIIDAYLGKIDTHKPDKRYARFEKGEIESLLGVSQIKPVDLEQRVKHLFQPLVIRDKNKKNGFTIIALFEKAECKRDKNGLWWVDLAASPSAMEYVFYPERLGYLRYGLRTVARMKSRYTYILFQYLEQNRKMHLSWIVPLTHLKRILKCADNEYYKDYYRFNEKILARCHKELNEKTECHFSYEPIKEGRVVVAVKFTLEPIAALAESEEVDEQLTFINDCQYNLSAACDNEFSKKEMEEICGAVAGVPENNLPPDPTGENSLETRQYYFLRQIYLKLNSEAERKEKKGQSIPLRQQYLVSMIKNEKAPKAPKKAISENQKKGAYKKERWSDDEN